MALPNSLVITFIMIHLSFAVRGVLPQFVTDISIPPVYVIGGIYLGLLFAGLLIDFIIMTRLLTVPVPWLDMVTHLKSRPWLGKDILWLVFILILVQFCAGIIYWAGVKLHLLMPPQGEASAALLQGILFHGVAFLIVCVFVRRRQSSWQTSFGMTWQSLKRTASQGLIGYVGILPVVFVTSLLIQVLFFMAGQPVTLQDVVDVFLEQQPAWSLLFLFLLAVVVAPLVEEILFRGILLTVLVKRIGTGLAVVISSLIFAGIHMHLPSFFPLFTLAVALSLLYIYSGSLWPSVILHSVFNGASICVLLLTAP
jgi:membrane protease YdiL (CAAX protease family)